MKVILLFSVLIISSLKRNSAGGQVQGYSSPYKPDELPPSELPVPGQLENVALRGKATQSTILRGRAAALSHAGNAIDGNRDSHFFHGSCTHTTRGHPWWRVDLLKMYDITSVNITNRRDCCAERITGAQIRIGSSLEKNGLNNPRCSTITPMSAGETRTFHCAQPMHGRYVVIYLPKAEYLTLCEVEVNALVPPQESYLG